MDDRRQEKRSAPVLRGPAAIDAGRSRMDVTIVNVSHSGVMIAMMGNAQLPAAISLVIGNMLRPCELIWRDGRFAGLRFID
ncbi:MAG: PilZ domain-containing protein [Devosia sp.]|nr:PilZ domain-containing protein [Devosia sp.]